MNANAKIFVPSQPQPILNVLNDYEQIQMLISNNTIIPLREDETSIYYDVVDGPKQAIIAKRWLSLEQFKATSTGFGGRVGLLAYFIDENGKRQYILNISNRGYYSDFGGGLKSNWIPYDGLVKELKDEAPQWAEYFIKHLNETDFPPVIYSTENVISSKQQLRTDIMIILRVDQHELDLNKFTPTKEVIQLKIVDDDQLNAIFQNEYEKLNNGLRLIESIYPEVTTYMY